MAPPPAGGAAGEFEHPAGFPWASLVLLIGSLVVFIIGVLFPIGFPESLTEKLMLFTDGPQPYQFLTYGFVHYGWIHAAFNMGMLALLAPALERRIGSAAMLGLHLAVCLIVAAAYMIWVWTLTDLPPAAGGTLPGAASLGALLLFLRYDEEPPRLRVPGVGEIEWGAGTASLFTAVFLVFNLAQPLLRYNKVIGYEDFGWFVVATHLAGLGTGALIVTASNSRRVARTVHADFAELSSSIMPGAAGSSSTYGPLTESTDPSSRPGGDTTSSKRKSRPPADVSAIMQSIDACDVNQAYAAYKAAFRKSGSHPGQPGCLDADYQWRLGQLLLSEYREEEAMAVLEALVKHHPVSAPYTQAQYELGLLYATRPETREQAINCLVEALEGDRARDRAPDTGDRRPISIQARRHAEMMIAKLRNPESESPPKHAPPAQKSARSDSPLVVEAGSATIRVDLGEPDSNLVSEAEIWAEAEKERKKVPVPPKTKVAEDDLPLVMPGVTSPSTKAAGTMDYPELAKPEPVNRTPEPVREEIIDTPTVTQPPKPFIPPPPTKRVVLGENDDELLDEPLPQPIPPAPPLVRPVTPPVLETPPAPPNRPMTLGDLKMPPPPPRRDAPPPAPPVADPNQDTAPAPGTEVLKSGIGDDAAIPTSRRLAYRPEDVYAVILAPGTAVKVDPVAELLPRFLKISSSAALHAVKSRHGILATELDLKDAEALAEALAAAGQPVYLVEEDQRIAFGEPHDAIRMTFKPGTVAFHTLDRTIKRNWSDLMAVGCGRVQLSAGAAGRDVIDLHFQDPGLHLRVWKSTLMAAPPHFSGKRDNGEEFHALGRAIHEAAPAMAIRATSFSQWIASKSPEITDQFASLIEYDSYVMWYLMAYHARAKEYKVEAKDGKPARRKL